MGNLKLPYTLKQAAEAIGKSKPTVLRAIQAGRISAIRDEATGGWLIEPAELHRIYETDVKRHGVTMRNGGDEPAETRELRGRLDDAFATIDDLRRRLDAEAEERRRLTALLTDQRTNGSVPATAPDSPREDTGLTREAERRLADKDATITGLVAEQQTMRREVETLTELLKARRSWWHRVIGR